MTFAVASVPSMSSWISASGAEPKQARRNSANAQNDARTIFHRRANVNEKQAVTRLDGKVATVFDLSTTWQEMLLLCCLVNHELQLANASRTDTTKINRKAATLLIN